MRLRALGQALALCDALLGSHDAQRAGDAGCVVEVGGRVTAIGLYIELFAWALLHVGKIKWGRSPACASSARPERAGMLRVSVRRYAARN